MQVHQGQLQNDNTLTTVSLGTSWELNLRFDVMPFLSLNNYTIKCNYPLTSENYNTFGSQFWNARFVTAKLRTASEVFMVWVPMTNEVVSIHSNYRTYATNLVPYNNIVTNFITDMASLFSSITFNDPIDSWDVSNVTDMSSMFYYANTFGQAIGNWNVSNVNNMSNMFSNTNGFNSPIGLWNTQNVTNMDGMFKNAALFNSPIGLWNTQNVTNMNGMFKNAALFNQTIELWNITNVTPKPPTEFNAGSQLSINFLPNWYNNQTKITTVINSINHTPSSSFTEYQF
jgi:surface protein